MQEFCPLCIKNDIKRRLKAFQINLQEAVWVCEGKDCIWPFGYRELMFLQRIAVTCDWEKPHLAKEYMSMSTDFSLYTPPVTPGGEFSKELTDIVSTEYSPNLPIKDTFDEMFFESECINSKELVNSNSLSLLKPLKLKTNDFTEETKNNTTEENMSIFRTLPEVISIQKRNVFTTILSNVSSSDDKRIQEDEQSLRNGTSIIDIIRDSDASFDITLCKELNGKIEEENNQIKEKKLQSNATMNQSETNLNCNIDALLSSANAVAKLNIDSNIVKSSNMINRSILTTSGNDLNTDAMLEHILTTKSYTNIAEDVNDDWLNSLLC